MGSEAEEARPAGSTAEGNAEEAVAEAAEEACLDGHRRAAVGRSAVVVAVVAVDGAGGHYCTARSAGAAVALRGVDLHGVDLRGVDLRGVDLHGMDLHCCSDGLDHHGCDIL